MSDIETVLHELMEQRRNAPWWKRTCWRARAWLWPVEWISQTGTLRVCLPVMYVAGGMLGARRWTWLRSPKRRVPVGFDLQVRGIVTWRRIDSHE